MSRKKQQKRRFAGQHQAERLANWLNQERPVVGRHRIGALITAIQEYLSSTKSERRGIGPRDHSALVGEEIDRYLQRYSGSVDIRIVDSDMEGEEQIRFGLAWRPESKISREETSAFLDVFNLARNGNIRKLRECEGCSSWIFVRFPDGDRAQKRCRVCANRNRKHYMREYMRRERKEERLRSQRAKKAVGYGRR